MIRGGQTTVEFDVVNAGGAASDPVTVSIPNAPWLKVGSANPARGAGPGWNKSRHSVADACGRSAAWALRWEHRAERRGGFTRPAVYVPCGGEFERDLQVEAVDEFTYYAAGAPGVTNATVTIRDAFTHETITNGVTDGLGHAFFPQLTEGYYEVAVSAEKHSQFLGTVFVKGGRTNEFETFLSRETVQYRWTVVPTQIEDRTRIVIETLFETFVPAPVVTIEPALIDLQDFTGSETQINLTIHNHGLVAAQEFTLNFPEHPDFTFTPLVTDIGALGAETSIVVPLMIKRGASSRPAPTNEKSLDQARGSSGGGACSISGGGCWTLPCGKRKNQYCASVSVINLGCPPSVSIPGLGGSIGNYTLPPPPPNGPGGGIATGSGRGGLGGFFTPPRTFEPPNICDCDKDKFEEKCKEIPLSSSVINAGVQALATALSTIPNLSVKAKTDAKVSACICCDDDGLGLKVSGGGSVTFDGTVSVPFAGAGFTKTFQSGGYSIDAKVQLGCTYEQGIKLVGSVSGGTKCHLKDLEVCGEVSIDLPASIPCEASVTLIASQGGVEKGRKEIKAGASLNYGLSGSVKYCKNAGGSQTSGEICGKGLTFKAGISVQFAELGIDFSPELEQELAPGDCYQFGSGSKASLAMKRAAEAEYESKKKESKALGAAKTLARAAASGAAAPAHAVAAAEEGGVCAKVRLQINQDVVLTRNAFKATLELDNVSPSSLTDVGVTLFVVDENGNAVDERFGFQTPVLSGINGIDGTGVLSGNTTGTSTFILVPTSDAAPNSPVRYGVGGILSYKQDGQEIVIPLYPAPITVYPDPRLVVKYFHERDVFGDDPFTRDIVEPSVPFNLGVMVQNVGGGIARNVRIVSGQPQIIENEKGLLIDFRIIGTEVAGQAQSPSLTAIVRGNRPRHQRHCPLVADEHAARFVPRLHRDL